MSLGQAARAWAEPGGDRCRLVGEEHPRRAVWPTTSERRDARFVFGLSNLFDSAPPVHPPDFHIDSDGGNPSCYTLA